MWIGLKLLASGALDGVLRGLSAALKWLLADWRNAVVGTVLPGFFWMTLVIAPGLRAERDEARGLHQAEQLAHLGTITGFRKASEQAQADAQDNADRVKAEQEKITDATLADYRSDLAVLRARFARLRDAGGSNAADRLRAVGTARTNPRRADPAGLPAAGDAAGRADAAPPDQDLPAAGDLTPQPLCPAGLVCLTIDQAQQASEDAHRHNRLIDWVFGQSAIRFTPSEGAR